MGEERPHGSSDRFSLIAGGPFHALLRRFGLIGADHLPTRRAAIGLALLAWAPPAVLALTQYALDRSYPGLGYFTDWTVYARYLIGVWVMVWTEHHAEGRFTVLVRQFHDAELVPRDHLPSFERTLDIADRRSSSVIPEVIALVAAVVVSQFTLTYAVELADMSWEGSELDGGVSLSWAGLYARYVSNPLFLFLVFRWVWRFLVWTVLLFRISRLPLQLAPMHPDRCGGLGFLGIYPSVYRGFVFALSCVVASSFLKDLTYEQHTMETVWMALGAWIALIVVLFCGPLYVFAPLLYATRERAILEYGRLVHQHHLAFHRKWIQEEQGGEGLLGGTDPSSAADLSASVETVAQMRLAPVDRAAMIYLLAAASVPLPAVVLTQVPLGELLKWIAGTLL